MTTTSGIEVVVSDDGYATLDFVDHSLRGPALAKLIESGGPETIHKLTRRGPRQLYRVPEGNAREAGLLDDSSAVDAHPAGDSGFAAATAAAFTGQPSPQQAEQPSEDWSRAQLDAYAASRGLDTTTRKSKADVLAAINS